MREVYQAACEAEPPAELPDKDVVALAQEYAAVERDLQEIDRARCAQLCLFYWCLKRSGVYKTQLCMTTTSNQCGQDAPQVSQI